MIIKCRYGFFSRLFDVGSFVAIYKCYQFQVRKRRKAIAFLYLNDFIGITPWHLVFFFLRSFPKLFDNKKKQIKPFLAKQTVNFML